MSHAQGCTGLGPRGGVSIRALAAAAGLSPARVHQITAGADLDVLDAALRRHSGDPLTYQGRPVYVLLRRDREARMPSTTQGCQPAGRAVKYLHKCDHNRPTGPGRRLDAGGG
jgi:hypothetical protein